MINMTRVVIPAGLWLRTGGPRLSVADDVAFRALPEEQRFTLLIGAPGEPAPTASQVAEVIATLTPADRGRVALTGYGAEQPGDASLAQRLADLLERPVRAHHGLLLTGPGPIAARTAMDRSGRPSWRPFAQLSTYRPGRVGASVDHWRAPFEGAEGVGPASYRLTADWTIDVVPAGLVVRPAGADRDPLLRAAPTDPDHVDLVVDGVDGILLPDSMLTALGRLADALPTAARGRLRVVLTPGVPQISARALGWAVPAPQLAAPIGQRPVLSTLTRLPAASLT
jgi:hypothetical protein